MNANHFIFDAVRHYADSRADQAALVFGDRVTTYADLELRARRVANGLTSLGLEPQSRVAILTGNNDVFFEIWLGAALGNFVLTPINARLAPPKVAYIVNDSQEIIEIMGNATGQLADGFHLLRLTELVLELLAFSNVLQDPER